MNKQIVKAVFCLAILAISSSAWAFGIGAYAEIGAGNDDIIPMGGIMFDTSVAKNEIFNYRLKLGGGKIITSKFTKVGLIQALGVSPSNIRGNGARFWFGPRIGIHYVGGEKEVANDNFLTMWFMPVTKKKFDFARFDLGLVLLGFNFNFGSAATLTFEFGSDYGVYIGDTKKAGMQMSSVEGFANIGFMYRINDVYEEAK